MANPVPRRPLPATDLTLAAASGLLFMTGDADRPPVRVSGTDQSHLFAGRRGGARRARRESVPAADGPRTVGRRVGATGAQRGDAVRRAIRLRGGSAYDALGRRPDLRRRPAPLALPREGWLRLDRIPVRGDDRGGHRPFDAGDLRKGLLRCGHLRQGLDRLRGAPDERRRAARRVRAGEADRRAVHAFDDEERAAPARRRAESADGSRRDDRRSPRERAARGAGILSRPRSSRSRQALALPGALRAIQPISDRLRPVRTRSRRARKRDPRPDLGCTGRLASTRVRAVGGRSSTRGRQDRRSDVGRRRSHGDAGLCGPWRDHRARGVSDPDRRESNAASRFEAARPARKARRCFTR